MTAEARILDAEGRLLAHGTSTLMVLGGGKRVTGYGHERRAAAEDSEA